MTNIVFLEISTNSNIEDPKGVFNHLRKLGYSPRSIHNVSGAQFWIQNRSILLLREDPTLDRHVKVTGLGLLLTEEDLDLFPEAYFDMETDFYVVHNDARDFTFYLTTSDNMSQNYQILPKSDTPKVGIRAVMGLVLQTTDTSTISLLERACSKIEEGNKYKKYVFENKVAVFLDESGEEEITTLIIDVLDIFNITRYFTVNNKEQELLDFPEEDISDFGELGYMIKGYNCKLFGNETSYSIENFLEDEVLDIGIIFRQRKQYIKIKEESLEYYDSIK